MARWSGMGLACWMDGFAREMGEWVCVPGRASVCLSAGFSFFVVVSWVDFPLSLAGDRHVGLVVIHTFTSPATAACSARRCRIQTVSLRLLLCLVIVIVFACCATPGPDRRPAPQPCDPFPSVGARHSSSAWLSPPPTSPAA